MHNDSSSLKMARGIPAYFRVVFLASLVILGFIFAAQSASAQTAEEYCSQYPSGSKRNACLDGTKSGFDCNDYAITFGESIAGVCRQSKKAKQDGIINGVPTTPSQSPSGSGSDRCEGLSGDLLDACTGGQENGTCNKGVAIIDLRLYNACAIGAGIPTLSSQPADQTRPSPSPSPSPSSGSEYESSACYGLAGDLLDACNGGAVYKQCNPQVASVDLQLYQACALGAGLPVNDNYSSNSPYPSSSPSSPFDNAQNYFQMQDQLDQADSLSQYTDVLHQSGQDADVDLGEVADNNRGSYVNGAGKQQRIDEFPCENASGSCPALIWFDGGGWHADDGVAEKIATGSSSTTNNDPNAQPPAGGGANARGYTVFNATYRLGSDGIYYQFEDVMRAIQHIVNNADMYGIDTSRLAIGGDSAGASLAIRAAATGKTGAKAAVGWSTPTNAYTAIFKSFDTFAIGIDHSTCIPTDLAGLANTTDLLAGGSGNVAKEGEGISSNDFSNLGITQSEYGLGFDQGSIGSAGIGGTVTDLLSAVTYTASTASSLESISSQLQSGSTSGLAGGLVNLSSKKLIECIDNLNSASPALFASPETPPTFLAGYTTDDLIDPSQAYEMRDKLRGLGVRSEVLLLEGDTSQAQNPLGATPGNHLDYHPIFVCPTFQFLDEILRPDNGIVNCETGVTEGDNTTDTGSGSGGSGGGNGDSSGQGQGGDQGQGEEPAGVTPRAGDPCQINGQPGKLADPAGAHSSLYCSTSAPSAPTASSCPSGSSRTGNGPCTYVTHRYDVSSDAEACPNGGHIQSTQEGQGFTLKWDTVCAY